MFFGGGYANVVVIISEGKVNASDGFVSFPRSLTSHRTAGLFCFSLVSAVDMSSCLSAGFV